jgi:hypothetical protein
LGRVNKYKLSAQDHWIEFGKWLEFARGLTPLIQEEAAAGLGITRRQWIRYTQGAPFPRKRIPNLASVLGIPVGRVYMRAGYEVPDLGVDVNFYLRRIRESVLGDNMAEAMGLVYAFYYEAAQWDKRAKLPDTSRTRQDFIDAAVAADRLPGWLRLEFAEYLLATELSGERQDFPLKPELRRKIRAKIKESLPDALRFRIKTHPKKGSSS